MAVNIQGIPAPVGATLDIKIEISAPVNITAYVAQQKVTQFVIRKIGNQLCGDPPDLHVGDRLCWSVPVVLGSPVKGIIGRVGEILVDVNTGELLVGKEKIEEITANAKSLAERCPL